MADDMRGTLAAFRRLPKEASKSLREGSQALSEALAGKAQAAAAREGRQATLVGPTIKARKDRVPTISMGGSVRVGRNRVPVYKVMFGAEFGANRLPQFKPHTGREGYFFYPTIRTEGEEFAAMWQKVADDVGRAWVGNDAGVSAVKLKGML